MIRKILSAALMTAAVCSPVLAWDFDGRNSQVSMAQAISSIDVPKAPAPSKAEAAPEQTLSKTASCMPLLMAFSAGGVAESVVIERVCTPENLKVWTLKVELASAKDIFVRVSSSDSGEQGKLIEKRIKAMLLEGMTETDADVITGKVGPLLKEAAGAGTAADREKLLASAFGLLKNYLARP